MTKMRPCDRKLGATPKVTTTPPAMPAQSIGPQDAKVRPYGRDDLITDIRARVGRLNDLLYLLAAHEGVSPELLVGVKEVPHQHAGKQWTAKVPQVRITITV